MAKEKVTITLDRAKAEEARALGGAKSTSEVIDMALDHFIRTERIRADVEAYRRRTPNQDELDLAPLGDTDSVADDTDWEALYADDAS